MHSSPSTQLQPSHLDIWNTSISHGDRSNSRLRRIGHFICLVLVSIILTGTLPTSAFGQGKTAKKPKATTKKTKAGDEEEPSENPLQVIDFGSAPFKQANGDTPIELDATPEGRERLAKLEARAREIFQERDEIDLQLRPLVVPRDRLVGEVTLLNQALVAAQQAIVQGQTRLRNLQRQANEGGNNDGANLNLQIANTERQLMAANNVVTVNQKEIAERGPEITALNLQIQPLEQQLTKLWLELNDFRKQWLEIRQPQVKYAHGNFEALKRVIDDWLLIDGLWPEAFSWAALTNYELGNYESAWEYVDRATELRRKLGFPKAWAQGEALRGMIASHLPERRGKSAGHLQSAQLYVNKEKNSNWEVFFLLGRAAVENDKLAVKARTNFDKALKINSDATCVKYWYAHLQTTAATASVRDVTTGTKTLEELWERSTKQSWRLAHGLVLAYDAADRKEDADRTWEIVSTLAPKSQLGELQEARETAAEKLKSLEANPTSTKSKTTKSSGKASN